MEMTFEESLDAIVNWPLEISIVLGGNQGLGKTSCCYKAGKVRSELIGAPCPVIVLRLSQKMAGDVIGMPYQVDGRTVFAPPDWFPIRAEDNERLRIIFGNVTKQISIGEYGENGFLFLDEFTRAIMELQQMGMQLIEERTLNGFRLPDGWRVISAINDNLEIYRAQVMESAIMSRFAYIDFAPSHDEAMGYYKEARVHDSILEFHKANDFDWLDPSDDFLKTHLGRKVHDRRAWEKLSKTITKLENDFNNNLRPFHPLDKSDKVRISALAKVACAHVGDEAGEAYRNYVVTEYKALTADMILNSWGEKEENQVKALVEDGGRAVELAYYNEKIVELTLKDKLPLSKRQSSNLINYCTCLPRELCMNFWTNFNSKNRDVANAWYDDNEDATTLIMNCLYKPKEKELV